MDENGCAFLSLDYFSSNSSNIQEESGPPSNSPSMVMEFSLPNSSIVVRRYYNREAALRYLINLSPAGFSGLLNEAIAARNGDEGGSDEHIVVAHTSPPSPSPRTSSSPIVQLSPTRRQGRPRQVNCVQLNRIPEVLQFTANITRYYAETFQVYPAAYKDLQLYQHEGKMIVPHVSRDSGFKCPACLTRHTGSQNVGQHVAKSPNLPLIDGMKVVPGIKNILFDKVRKSFCLIIKLGM